MTKPKKKDDEHVADARPTKELFIDMLIRDLSLSDAIGDLVDNSADAALKLKKQNLYKNLWVQITYNKTSFTISDNCGGIDLNTAENYAFRFGRLPTTPSLNKSVGQFGIGMKRALFKLGSHFNIVSTTKNSRFVLNIDVPTWKAAVEDPQNPTAWTFPFEEYVENYSPKASETIGTVITITKLHDDVVEQFGSELFHKQLVEEIRLEQMFNLERKLAIRINSASLRAPVIEIFADKHFKPALWEKTYPNKVKVTVKVGIGEPILASGGWYVFCNNRLVVGPEQTATTGWTSKQGNAQGGGTELV